MVINLDIIKFLNTNSDAIQSLGNILILIVTTIYVIINSLMHREMVKARQQQERPQIGLRLLRVEHNFYNLLIENISKVPLYDLKFLKYPKLKIVNKFTTHEIGFIKNGIKYMSPKQEYETLFLLASNIKDFSEDIVFEIQFQDKNQNKYVEIIRINLSVIEKVTSIDTKYNKKISQELEKIRKGLQKN